MKDKHLWPVLEPASASDLEPIIELIEQKSINWSRPADVDVLRAAIHDELLASGGNSIVNIFRGSGPSWGEIVRDAARKLKVTFKSSDTTVHVEEQVAFTVLERAVDSMTPEQIKELRDNLERAGLPRNTPIGKGLLLAAMAAGELSGFAVFQILVIVANAVMRVLVGRGLAFIINVALTRLLAVVLGPVGWTVFGAWTAIDISGPAYRITIPAVVLIATLRAQQKLAAQQGVAGAEA